MSEQRVPFKTLGSHLKYLREQSSETLAEVSGAVEIDETTLVDIEEGYVRPDEEILTLLISHFSMSTSEAIQIWQLAGYDGEPDYLRTDLSGASTHKNVVMVMTMDPRAVYTDGIEIDCNQAGMTLNFSQAGKNEPTIVSKVGMSYDQAEKVYEALQGALLRAKYLRGPKHLPPKASK